MPRQESIQLQEVPGGFHDTATRGTTPSHSDPLAGMSRTRTSKPPAGLAGFRGGGLHGTGKAARRDTSPTAPRFPPPVARSSAQAANLYSHSPERRTAPRRGLSARAGTPKERFCNTTHAGVSGHDNARGFYDAITRGRLAPQNLIKPKIQPGNATPPGRARH